jgi:hypothetical protein
MPRLVHRKALIPALERGLQEMDDRRPGEIQSVMRNIPHAAPISRRHINMECLLDGKVHASET